MSSPSQCCGVLQPKADVTIFQPDASLTTCTGCLYHEQMDAVQGIVPHVFTGMARLHAMSISASHANLASDP